MKRYLSIVPLVALVVLLLGACGGGGGEATPTAAAAGPSAQEVLNAINVEMHDIY